MSEQPTITLKTLSISLQVGAGWQSTREVSGAEDAIKLAEESLLAADILGMWYSDARLTINKNLNVICRLGDVLQVVRDWTGEVTPTEESCYE